jgi:hypothetical protein
VHCFADDFDVGDAALDESDLVADFGEIFFLAGGKIVEHDDTVAAFYEFVYGVGSNEAGAACHHVTHAEILLIDRGREGRLRQITTTEKPPIG